MSSGSGSNPSRMRSSSSMVALYCSITFSLAPAAALSDIPQPRVNFQRLNRACSSVFWSLDLDVAKHNRGLVVDAHLGVDHRGESVDGVEANLQIRFDVLREVIRIGIGHASSLARSTRLALCPRFTMSLLFTLASVVSLRGGCARACAEEPRR